MLVIGLTGGIGMGKSHATRMFRNFGVPAADADAIVHRLLAPGGGAVGAVLAAFPEVLAEDGGVDRRRLGQAVFGDEPALRRLEAILHPRVRLAERRFLAGQARLGRRMALLDIPLLFESGSDRLVDRTVVVSAGQALQRARVMRRPGMTRARFASILATQAPDQLKRRRADFVIESHADRGLTAAQVSGIIRELWSARGTAWPTRWLATQREGA